MQGLGIIYEVLGCLLASFYMLSICVHHLESWKFRVCVEVRKREREKVKKGALADWNLDPLRKQERLFYGMDTCAESRPGGIYERSVLTDSTPLEVNDPVPAHARHSTRLVLIAYQLTWLRNTLPFTAAPFACFGVVIPRRVLTEAVSSLYVKTSIDLLFSFCTFLFIVQFDT